MKRRNSLLPALCFLVAAVAVQRPGVVPSGTLAAHSQGSTTGAGQARTPNPDIYRGVGIGRLGPQVPAADIPNVRAYGLLFQLLITMPEGLDGPRAGSYLQRMGLRPGCAGCTGGSNGESVTLGSVSDSAVATEFVAIVREVHSRLLPVNQRKEALVRALPRDSNNRVRMSPSDRARIAALNSERDRVIDTHIAALTGRLGAVAASRIQTFVDNDLKPQMLYYRDLSSVSGSVY